MGEVTVELILYVIPESLPSQRAQVNLQGILDQFDQNLVDFRVCDLTLDPGLAEQDGIIVTPTLIKRSPAPTVWIVGDLSRGQAVIDLLASCGITPKVA